MPSSRTRITTFSPSMPADEPDVAAGLGVFRGVGEQVDDDLLEPGRVGLDPEVPRESSDQLVLTLLDERPDGFDGRVGGSPRRRAAPVRSRTLPRLIRETSMRSSISRARCLHWRAMTSLPHSSSSTPVRPPGELHGVADGGERVAELVGEHREELVLAAVRFFQGLLDSFPLGDVLDDERELGIDRRVPGR